MTGPQADRTDQSLVAEDMSAGDTGDAWGSDLPLFSEQAPDLCNAEEEHVYRVLRKGRANARRIDAISDLTGIPSRRVQSIIDHLIMDHRIAIGSSMSEPYGAYLISDKEDLDKTVGLLRSRGLHSLARAAALRDTALPRLLGEIQMELLGEVS